MTSSPVALSWNQLAVLIELLLVYPINYDCCKGKEKALLRADGRMAHFLGYRMLFSVPGSVVNSIDRAFCDDRSPAQPTCPFSVTIRVSSVSRLRDYLYQWAQIDPLQVVS
jgi:hypothetical protein